MNRNLNMNRESVVSVENSLVKLVSISEYEFVPLSVDVPDFGELRIFYVCVCVLGLILISATCFAAYEWCMTNSFDLHNQEHQKIKAEIELGNGLPDIRVTGQCLEALKQAGFEVMWDIDLAADSPVPWYLPLEQNQFSLTGFRLTAAGRFITRNMLKGLEYIGLAPKGSRRVHNFLEKAADGLVNGGRKEIFTPMYFFLARKPLG